MRTTSTLSRPSDYYRRYYYGFYGFKYLNRIRRIPDRGLLLPVHTVKQADRDIERAQDRNDKAH